MDETETPLHTQRPNQRASTRLVLLKFKASMKGQGVAQEKSLREEAAVKKKAANMKKKTGSAKIFKGYVLGTGEGNPSQKKKAKNDPPPL